MLPREGVPRARIRDGSSKPPRCGRAMKVPLDTGTISNGSCAAVATGRCCFRFVDDDLRDLGEHRSRIATLRCVRSHTSLRDETRGSGRPIHHTIHCMARPRVSEPAADGVLPARYAKAAPSSAPPRAGATRPPENLATHLGAVGKPCIALLAQSPTSPLLSSGRRLATNRPPESDNRSAFIVGAPARCRRVAGRLFHKRRGALHEIHDRRSQDACPEYGVLRDR